MKNYEIVFKLFIDAFVTSDTVHFPTVHQSVGVLLWDQWSLRNNFLTDDSDEFSVDYVSWRCTHFCLNYFNKLSK